MSQQDGRSAGRAPAHWCKKLRWKSYPIDEHDAALANHVFVEGGQVYSCLWTASPGGPDDGLCAPELCTSSRGCYEPHPTLVALRRVV